jgi:hypothetical protein
VWRRKREKEENKIADGRWRPVTRHLGLPLNQTRNMPIQPNIKAGSLFKSQGWIRKYEVREPK